MNRRRFVVTSLAGLLAAPHTGQAQPHGRVYRLGFLSLQSAANPIPSRQPFLQALRELGWVEGQNIKIEWRFADGVTARLPSSPTSSSVSGSM